MGHLVKCKRRTFIKTGEALGLSIILPISLRLTYPERKNLKSNSDSPYTVPLITAQNRTFKLGGS